MPRIVQIIGNGDCAVYYNEEPKRKGLKLTCNVSPFTVDGVYATCIVDFKMMNTLQYAANYTDFNCGHMATYYACEKLKADEVHLWGFDSIFDFNLRSYTDVVINSDRGGMNNHRLANNWRPLWKNMFKDFDGTGKHQRVKFVLHHKHNKLKFQASDNVEIEVHGKK